MNPSDPYYAGALPELSAFALGIVLILVVGWAIRRKFGE
jgi:hypothetical protein